MSRYTAVPVVRTGGDHGVVYTDRYFNESAFWALTDTELAHVCAVAGAPVPDRPMTPAAQRRYQRTISKLAGMWVAGVVDMPPGLSAYERAVWLASEPPGSRARREAAGR